MAINRDGYQTLKTELGHRPSRAEMYQALGEGFKTYIKDGWLAYLANLGDLKPVELEWLNGPVEEFLLELEKTLFQKSYKIPTILTFVTEQRIRDIVTLSEIGLSFQIFYTHESELRELDFQDKCNQGWEAWDNDDWAKLALHDPVEALDGKGFFHYDSVGQVLRLDERLGNFLNEKALVEHVKDVMEYRKSRYLERRCGAWKMRKEVAAGNNC